MKNIVLIIFCTLLIREGKCQQLPAPDRLRCELLLNTATVSRNGLLVEERLENAIQQSNIYQFANINNSLPAFSWELSATIKRATAWRIVVASSEKILDQNRGDYWDSKRTLSGSSRATYNGKKLIPGKIYHWKVQVWNDENKQSTFSATQSFYLAPYEGEPGFAHYPLKAQQTGTRPICKISGILKCRCC